MPLSLISSERWYSSQTESGTGNFDSIFWMDISTSTSRLLYSLKVAHLSGACSGRFQSLPPFTFVGLQGTEKYLISALPSVIF